MATRCVLISLLLLSVPSSPDDIQTVEVNTNGEISINTNGDDPNSINVEFENQSGETVELYTDTETEVFFKGSLEHNAKLTVSARVGDYYYFTEPGSGGSHDGPLLHMVLTETTEHVILEGSGQTEGEQLDEIMELGCKESGDCIVRVDNEYGEDVIVYWDDGKDGISQGIALNHAGIRLDTFLGHTFFVTTTIGIDRIFEFTIGKDMDVLLLTDDDPEA